MYYCNVSQYCYNIYAHVVQASHRDPSTHISQEPPRHHTPAAAAGANGVQMDAVSSAVIQQEMLEQDKLRREKEERLERQNALLQAQKFSKVSVGGFMRRNVLRYLNDEMY